MRVVHLFSWVLALTASYANGSMPFHPINNSPEPVALLTGFSDPLNHPDSAGVEWRRSKGEKLLLYLQLSATTGISLTGVTNLPERLNDSHRISYGAGLDAVLLDGFFGRLPIGVYYQSAGLSVAELNYIKIPVQYQFYIGTVKRLFLGGGVYKGWLVSSSPNGSGLDLGNLKKTDTGLMASAGYWLTLNKFNKTARLILQASAQWGLTDIDSSTGSNLDKNRMYFVSIGYSLFAGRSNRLPRFGPMIRVN